MLTILLTALATLIVVLVIANLSSGEKTIEHNIERLYASDDPQFLRSMGLLLGPPVIGGNRFEVLANGDEIFPSMLAAVRSAQKSITFETLSIGQARSANRWRKRLPTRHAPEWRCMCCWTGWARRRWTGAICRC